MLKFKGSFLYTLSKKETFITGFSIVVQSMPKSYLLYFLTLFMFTYVSIYTFSQDQVELLLFGRTHQRFRVNSITILMLLNSKLP